MISILKSFITLNIGHRFIIKNFVKRDLRVKYRQSILGFFWTFLKPLCIFLIINFVFSLFFRFDVKTRYSFFLLVSLFPWLFFQSSLTEGTFSILSNSNLIKKVAFPREIIPTSFCISSFIHFLLSYSIILLLIIAFIQNISFRILAIIPLLLLLFLLTVGLSLLLAPLNVFFRDVGHSLEVFLMLLFYVTPIFYPLNLVRENMQEQNWPDFVYYLYIANPMTYIVSSLRMSLLYPGEPFVELGPISYLSYSLFSILLILCIFHGGVFLFKKVEGQMLDAL